MISNENMAPEELTDTELVTRSLGGDREAFSRIVTRYQILICSLAYSRLGHLGQSEDVAQETFITAWKRLRLLREPAKLRAWLCGIVNHRAYKALRREGREPVRLAEPLEAVPDSAAGGALPSEAAINREEEAILWRSLERIPELYRQPLILFYRQHESVAAVAAQLELSEDAVKQRLSRGRKLLHEEVQAFVENTLRRTAPSQRFSNAVLAALPAGPAAGVSASMAGKGAAAAKSGLLATWLAALAPFLGILAGIVTQWLVVCATTPPGRTRRARLLEVLIFWVCVLGLAVGGEASVLWLGRRWDWSSPTQFCAMAGFWWCFAVVLLTWQIGMVRRDWARQRAHSEDDTAVVPLRVRVSVVTGMHLAQFCWLIALAWNSHDRLTAAVVAGIMVCMALWNLAALAGASGRAAARLNGYHTFLCGLVTLLVVNVRLDVWLAARDGITVAEIHERYPLWLVPLLTLALLGGLALLGYSWRRADRSTPKI